MRQSVRAGDAVIDGELLAVDASGIAVDKQQLRPVAGKEVEAIKAYRQMRGGNSSSSASSSSSSAKPSPYRNGASLAAGTGFMGGFGGMYGGSQGEEPILPAGAPIDPMDEDFLRLRGLAWSKRDLSDPGSAARAGKAGRQSKSQKQPKRSAMIVAQEFQPGGDYGARILAEHGDSDDHDDDEDEDEDGENDAATGDSDDFDTDAAGLHLQHVAFDVLFVDKWDEARIKTECKPGLLAQLELLRKTSGPQKGQLPSGDLTRLPQWQRNILLRALVRPALGRIHLHECTWVSSHAPKEVLDSLPAGSSDIDIMAKHLGMLYTKASEAKLEGIMLKRPDATYELGDRSKKWQKLKPEYVPGAMDTLDLAVLGACYSSGRSAGRRGLTGLTHFIVGCRVESPGDGIRFAPCGRVGTGYTFDELRQIQTRLSRCMVERQVPPGARRSGAEGSADLPKELFGESRFTPDHQPDFYVRPEAI